MNFQNTTTANALCYESTDQFGQQFHIVIVRQRMMITPDGLLAISVQPAILFTDEDFADGPCGQVYQESDLCPYKPFCDVIVNAIAHAPDGNAAPSVQVQLQVNHAPEQSCLMNAKRGMLVNKTLMVFGERSIVRTQKASRVAALLMRLATFGRMHSREWDLTPPLPFVACPVRYDYAFGGENRISAELNGRDEKVGPPSAENCLIPVTTVLHSDGEKDHLPAVVVHSVYDANPIGIGYVTELNLRICNIKSIKMPRTEYLDKPIGEKEFRDASLGAKSISPAGFGVIGRAWTPRRKFVGNFQEKEKWADDEIPRLPADFDHRYWNHAPEDQQCPHLRGDEVITLTNLSPKGAPLVVKVPGKGSVQQFSLPGHIFYLILHDVQGRTAVKQCLLDTVYIDSEASTVDLIWRRAISMEADLTRIILHTTSAEDGRNKIENLLTHQAKFA